MTIADKTLSCRDCGAAFAYTISEQAFYTERGFLPPSRCPDCRDNRKRERERLATQATMARVAAPTFREPRPLFPAVCADCGKSTMVPFEPRPGRPVYCRECFQSHKAEYQQ